MSHTPYDIRQAIREVLATTDLVDPGDIAARVAADVPGREIRAVLAVVLRDFVRIELHGYGRRAESGRDNAAVPQPARSAKVSAIRTWARLLRKPVAVEGNAWKQFGECTLEDLGFLAEDRRQNAAESVAAAERFEKYAAALAERDVETVAALPDDVIASIEGGDQ